YEFHEDVRHAVLFGNVVDGHDAGVGENAGGLRFAEQSLAHTLALGFVGEVLESDALDGDGPADGGIFGTVHDAHGSAAQFPNNLVPADLLHGIFILSEYVFDRISAEVPHEHRPILAARIRSGDGQHAPHA